MKLFYAPQSPFARKVRAAAIELGLEERLQLEYAEVVPGRPNTEYARSRNPLRRVPAQRITAPSVFSIRSTGHDLGIFQLKAFLEAELNCGGTDLPCERRLRCVKELHI